MSQHVQPFVVGLMVALSIAVAAAQQTAKPQPPPQTAKPQPAPGLAAAGASATLPADYVIGPEDVIGVMFWREAEMSGDVTVRPDGMITLPLLGDIRAAGLKPEALGAQVQKAAGKFLTDANATVVVRQINSRKVFVIGEVRTPGQYPLVAPRTILQILALAGGVSEYADSENITIVRTEANGTTRTLKFNYKDVTKGKKLEQNILLQPGDTITVP
jgi:polysaccharide export outer membrane protein